MPRTAIEILKARGYTDADLKSMETLLKDPKFTGALEAEAKAADDNAALVAANKNWYATEALPALEKAEKEALEARTKEAALRARIKEAQDRGMTIQAAMEGFEPAAPAPAVQPNTPAAVNPKDFVDTKTFAEAFGKTGDAIAIGIDIMQEHRELFGNRLPVKELLAEARAKNTTLENVWLQKYNVQAKRDELAAKAKTDEENRIRADERAKMASEYGNPNTRPPVASHSPFTRDRGAAGEEKNQPWRKSPEQAQQDRIAKVLPKVM